MPINRDVDYPNSPHLAHPALRGRLVALLLETVKTVAGSGLPLRVLEIGAGHGGYTAEALTAGCNVTAVELSRPSFRKLAARYGANPRVTTVFDPDGSLATLDGTYSLVLCISVLHHIPDYIAFIDRVTARLRRGGALLTLQDPLWYPRLSRLTRTVDRAAYLAWRIGQCNVGGGVTAMVRRLRGVYPAIEAGEIGYYHVVRQGVDEQAIARRLEARFDRVGVHSYWSNHLAAARRPAEMGGLLNTFAVQATGFIG
jgi:SAM-dependent methyltransferase